MALTKTERAEMMAEMREQVRAEMAANQGQNVTQIPAQPDVPELSIFDVMRVLVMHSRIPSTQLQDQCLAAIDRESETPDEEPTDVQPAPEEVQG